MANLINLIHYRKSYRAGLLMSKAFRILKKRTNDALEPYGLTATDWGVLGLLYEQPEGYRLSEIATELGVKAPFVTQSASVLSEKGYINIEPDKDDTRARRAQITKSGKSFVATTEQEVMSSVVHVFDGAGKRNLMGFMLTLVAMIEHTDEAEIENIDLDHMTEK